MGQTYQNFEAILVDDGSTDESGRICDCFSAVDSRVRVCHIHNSGPAAARNRGISLARGRFLSFIDADDYVDNDMYEVLIQRLLDNQVQMAVCNWYIHDHGQIDYSNIGKTGIVSARELRCMVASDDMKGGGGYPWNRVVDVYALKEKTSGLPLFPDSLKVYEDKIWVLRLLKHMDKILLTDYYGYHYVKKADSLTHRKTSERIDDFFSAWKIIESCFDELPEDAARFQSASALNQFWGLYREGAADQIKSLWHEYGELVKKGVTNFKGAIKYGILACVVWKKR